MSCSQTPMPIRWRGCALGGADAHFDTKEEAQNEAQARLSKKFMEIPHEYRIKPNLKENLSIDQVFHYNSIPRDVRDQIGWDDDMNERAKVVAEIQGYDSRMMLDIYCDPGKEYVAHLGEPVSDDYREINRSYILEEKSEKTEGLKGAINFTMNPDLNEDTLSLHDIEKYKLPEGDSIEDMSDSYQAKAYAIDSIREKENMDRIKKYCKKGTTYVVVGKPEYKGGKTPDEVVQISDNGYVMDLVPDSSLLKLEWTEEVRDSRKFQFKL